MRTEEKYIFTGAGGLIAGLLLSIPLVGRGYNPHSVHVLDLNGDKRPDLVVKSETGYYQDIFLQQEDGTYKRLDQLQTLEQKSIEAKAREIEAKAEKQ